MAISGLNFNSQAYYQTWDILCKKFGRPRIIVKSQFRKIYSHLPFEHENSSRNVRFTKLVTDKINVLIRPGFLNDLDSEGVLSSATKKLSLQLKEQLIRHLNHPRLQATNLIAFKEWLDSRTFIHEDLIAQTNSMFQSREKSELVFSHPTLMILQNPRT